jgi:hypothetical protein
MVICQRFFKLVKDDMGIKIAKFQIGKFFELIFQCLVAENILLYGYQQNIACLLSIKYWPPIEAALYTKMIYSCKCGYYGLSIPPENVRPGM